MERLQQHFPVHFVHLYFRSDRLNPDPIPYLLLYRFLQDFPPFPLSEESSFSVLFSSVFSEEPVSSELSSARFKASASSGDDSGEGVAPVDYLESAMKMVEWGMNQFRENPPSINHNLYAFCPIRKLWRDLVL